MTSAVVNLRFASLMTVFRALTSSVLGLCVCQAVQRPFIYVLPRLVFELRWNYYIIILVHSCFFFLSVPFCGFVFSHSFFSFFLFLLSSFLVFVNLFFLSLSAFFSFILIFLCNYVFAFLFLSSSIFILFFISFLSIYLFFIYFFLSFSYKPSIILHLSVFSLSTIFFLSFSYELSIFLYLSTI